MLNYKTLTFYLISTYLKYFLTTILILSGFFIVTNAFDIMHQFKNHDLSLLYFFYLIILKIPYLLNEVAGLISFLATLFFLSRLCKFHELIIILSNGISYWRILSILIYTNLVLGTIFLSIINPLGTYGLKKSEKLSQVITNKKPNSFVLLTKHILFFEDYLGERRIIRADSLNFSHKQLYNSTILCLDSDNNLLQRIDAESITIKDDKFNLTGVVTTNKEGTERQPSLVLPTKLSINNLINRFLAPQKMYIWNLPDVINSFLATGIPVVEYKVYYYKQLFKPLIMIAMVILAGCFINMNQRNNQQTKLMISALIIGLLVYLCLEVILRVLLSLQIDPMLAILLPIILIMSISNFVILHF